MFLHGISKATSALIINVVSSL
ncbi:hypothetical protein EMIT043CA1_20124 [Pseudomonas brassicacearum]